MPAVSAADSPEWLLTAKAEIGTAEVRGEVHNPRVVEYHSTTGLSAQDDETPWCSSFVNWVFEQEGIAGTDSAAARSWEDWGRPLERLVYGCVVVFWRGDPNGWQGHVGFYVGHDDQGRILVLGGNQGNAVSIYPYPVRRLVAMRWPTGVDLPPAERPRNPLATSTGVAVGAGTTAVAAGAPSLVGDVVGTVATHGEDAMRIIEDPATQEIGNIWPMVGLGLSALAVVIMVVLFIRKMRMERRKRA